MLAQLMSYVREHKQHFTYSGVFTHFLHIEQMTGLVIVSFYSK